MLLNKSIPILLIELRSAEQAKSFYERQLFLESPQLTANDKARSAETSSSGAASPTSTGIRTSQTFNRNKTTNSNSLNMVMPVLRSWLSHATPFLTQGEIFRISGIRSGSKQAKIKKRLLAEALISEHRLQRGKSYLVVWEPSQRAYELAGISSPTLSSKGGWMHKFAAFHISHWACAQGYKPETEFLLSSGKAVDLVLRKGSEIVFIEIAISKPLSKELRNIILDLQTNLKPDRIIIAVVDSKARTSMERILSSEGFSDSQSPEIKIQLIGSFVGSDHKAPNTKELIAKSDKED